jgi:hypothetical protein
MWMDWMAQGTRITGNLCYDNSSDDLLVEVDHGPFLVDNNLFLSGVSLMDMSESGAYAHNLMTGQIISRPEPRRSTPYHRAHSTALAGLSDIKGGDDRFYNNVLAGKGELTAATRKVNGKTIEQAAGYGLWVYDEREFPLKTGGNLYCNGARPYEGETDQVVLAPDNFKASVLDNGREVYLQLSVRQPLQNPKTSFVSTELLGQAKVSGVGYENPNGTPLMINEDYFGKRRNEKRPTVGPFENPGEGEVKLKVW